MMQAKGCSVASIPSKVCVGLQHLQADLPLVHCLAGNPAEMKFASGPPFPKVRNYKQARIDNRKVKSKKFGT
jgi:hypothetical protein